MSPLPHEPRECGDRDLPALLRRTAGPLVLESTFAGWEAPWRGLPAEAWQELSREFGGRVAGARIETGQNREFAERYGLEVIPGVLVFLGGRAVARFTGRVQAAQVIDAIHGALRQAGELASAQEELDEAVEEAPARVRSLRRRRVNEPSELALARAG